MAPPRKRTTPPADIADKQPANGLQALRAEVADEPDGAISYFTASLAGKNVRVKDFLDWPASANDLLAVGRFTQAAAAIVHPEDFMTVWAQVNPTNRQVIAFISEVERVVGIPLLGLLTSLSS